MAMIKDDLISRAALLNECAECQKTDPHFEERGWASNFINDAGEPSTEWWCVEDMIENAPFVDAAPVVHARWIDHKDEHQCSACKEFTIVDAYVWAQLRYDFCPACGARMDGGDEKCD